MMISVMFAKTVHGGGGRERMGPVPLAKMEEHSQSLLQSENPRIPSFQETHLLLTCQSCINHEVSLPQTLDLRICLTLAS